MQHRGKWVIAVVFALGVAASLFAVWHLNRQSRQALEFWGSDRARLIVQAPQAELLRLAAADEAIANPDSTSAERIEIAGRTYFILERRDAIATRGFIHVRRGLMTDAAFQWPAMPSADSPPWEYAVRFIDGPETAALAVAFDPPLATASQGQRVVSIAPMADGLKEFFHQAFQQPMP